ncbi:MAG: methyltransferase domain-containing protein [Acidobacteriota bacterium]
MNTVVDTYAEAVEQAETPSRAHTLLRGYSDDVNGRLLDRWLPERCGRLLKTDLFDEAVGRGLIARLERSAETVVAIDASLRVLEAAVARNPQLVAHHADVRALPFVSSSFNVVVSNSTLDHFDSLDDVAAGLRELIRVLEPGGTLIVTLDNLRHPLVALRNALPFSVLLRLGLVPYFVGETVGPTRLRRLLAEGGAHVIDETAIMHVPRIAAVTAARFVRSESVLRALSACERAEALPTRSVTGQFIAARAVKR